MANSKHTPGPWHREDDGSLWIRGKEDGEGGRLVAQAIEHGSDLMDVADANANLIAAAPELLAACRAALRRCEDAKAHFAGRWQGDDALMEQLRAAINKAEGH